MGTAAVIHAIRRLPAVLTVSSRHIFIPGQGIIVGVIPAVCHLAMAVPIVRSFVEAEQLEHSHLNLIQHLHIELAIHIARVAAPAALVQ